MAREFRSLTLSNVKAAASGRVRVGFAAIHGNVDSWDDRSHPGAFAKTLAENSRRVKHLWNHDSRTPPIATITEIKEVGPEEIPAEVLAKYPAGTITGGLMVAREYYENDLAEWVLEAIDKGDVNEMSYAFDVVKFDYTDEELPTGGTRRVRELREMKLFDTSDVNWGMNAATVASVKGVLDLMPLGTLYQQFLMHLDEQKAGRRNSASDAALIEQMHKIAVDLGAQCMPPAEEDPADSEDSSKNSNDTETKTGRAEAAGAQNSTSLTKAAEWQLRQRQLKLLGL